VYSVGNDNTGGFLPSVLQRKKPEITDIRNWPVFAPKAENSTFFFPQGARPPGLFAAHEHIPSSQVKQKFMQRLFA